MRAWSKHELFSYIVVIPLIFFLIYLLPAQIKESYFILYVNDPNVPSVFLMNFTHSDATHLFNNLSSYMILIFLLFNIEVNQRRFRWMMLLVLTVLPWLISISSIYLTPNIPPVQGFSGIVSGIDGYFVYSMYDRLKKLYNVKIDTNFVVSVILMNFAIVSLLSWNILIMIVSLLFSIILAYQNRVGIIEIIGLIRQGSKLVKKDNPLKRFYMSVVYFASVGIVFSLFTLLPSNIVSGSTLIDVFAHIVGYSLGVFVPLSLEVVSDLRKAT